MNRIKVAKALTALALALASAAGHAEFVKIDFTAHAVSASLHGDVTGLPGFSPSNSIGVGTTFAGYFYYDLSMPVAYDGSNGAGGTYTGYVGNPAQVGINFTSSTGYKFVTNDNTPDYQPRVEVEDGAVSSASPKDIFQVFGRGFTPSGAAQDATLRLVDTHSGATLNSTALPPTLSLANYGGDVSFYWSDNGGARWFEFVASIDTLQQVAAVPEPETYAMLLAGLALVGVAGQRKRKQQA